jgi:hypothetical protein
VKFSPDLAIALLCGSAFAASNPPGTRLAEVENIEPKAIGLT